METKDYRKKLILSADDFGASPAANDSILQLAKLGKIDRVAVMVNGLLPAKEVAELQATGVKLDIHLDFPKNKKHKQKESTLKRSAIFVMSYLAGKNRGSHLEKAWEEQIEKFKTIFGKYPDGLNSHQHIHFFPPYFKIIVKLSKKFGVPYVRFGRRAMMENANRVPRILETLRKKDKELFLSSGLETSDFWVSLDWISGLEKFLEHLPEGQTELVVHPERKDESNLLQKYF